LTGFADEICGTLARLIGYLCTPALIAMLGIHLWINCRTRNGNLPPKRGGARPRSAPAFAASQFDLSFKTDAYQVLRHPEGGRKDVLRWTDPDGGRAGSKSTVPAAT
jgi:hypothetical protein